MEPTTARRSRTAARICHICQTPIRSGAEGFSSDLCPKDFMEAGLENEHSDGYHQDAPNAECPDCGGSVQLPAPKPASVDTGRTNLSHTYPADCTTPAQRKAFRSAARKRAAELNTVGEIAKRAAKASKAPAAQPLPSFQCQHGKSNHCSVDGKLLTAVEPETRTVSFTLNEIEHDTDLQNSLNELAQHISYTLISTELNDEAETAWITIRTTATKAELAAAREHVI